MYKEMVFILAPLLMFTMSSNSPADEPTYYSEHTEGWYWYKDVKHDLQNNDYRSSTFSMQKNPIATMNELHRMENFALDAAFFDPTIENVKRYMVLQNLVSNRSQVFTKRWEQVLLEDPRLDYSITHPTSTQGRELYLEQYQRKEDAALLDFAKNEGLFFFYRGNCPYCHRFAPILKAFVQRYNIHVIPVSLGAGFLSEFPDSRLDQGQSQVLHVQIVPSLYAVNPKTQKMVPVAYGVMSYEELRQRILDLMTQFRGDL